MGNGYGTRTRMRRVLDQMVSQQDDLIVSLAYLALQSQRDLHIQLAVAKSARDMEGHMVKGR